MSQIDRRLKTMQQADLSEGRVNDDFVHWLKTWGQNILLGVLIIAAIAMGWFWWTQRQEKERDNAWAELGGANLPAALQEVAAKHEGKDAVAPFAELLAADRYLTAVLSDQRFDREAGAVDAALTPELRTEWLKAADTLYAKVAARITATARRAGSRARSWHHHAGCGADHQAGGSPPDCSVGSRARRSQAPAAQAGDSPWTRSAGSRARRWARRAARCSPS